MATTWSATPRGVKAVCTTGTEVAPTLTTEGLDLSKVSPHGPSVGIVSAIYEAAAAMTVAGSLKCYIMNPITDTWARCPDLDITIDEAVQYYASVGMEVIKSAARIAWLPSGISQAGTVYLFGLEG